MYCVKCKEQINDNAHFCRLCGAKVEPGEPPLYKKGSYSSERFDWNKILFNKYTAILVGVIFVVWLFSEEDFSSYGGMKNLLPAPVEQQTDEDTIEYLSTEPAVSLTNGTVLKRNTAYLYGNGKLAIDNGTSKDTIAKLIRGGSSIFTVYVKSESKYTITSIPDGTYFLLFAHGTDWDAASQVFRRNYSASRFDEAFDFITTEDYQYIYYPEFEVTLHPVTGGTADTSYVDPEQFDAY